MCGLLGESKQLLDFAISNIMFVQLWSILSISRDCLLLLLNVVDSS